MKKFAKTLLFSVLAIVGLFTVSMAAPATGSDPKARVELYFLRGNVVSPNGMITAELSANTAAEVDLVIENANGDSFGEKHVVIDNGAKLIRFKIEDVPAGTYYIKLVHRLREQTYSFLVK
jgi:hypothetical protein